MNMSDSAAERIWAFRWERVKIAVDGLVQGTGEETDDPVAKIEEDYTKDLTDEFLKPIIVGGAERRVKGGIDKRILISVGRCCLIFY